MISRITQEMSVAGSDVLEAHGVRQGREQLAIEVFRAMAAIAPPAETDAVAPENAGLVSGGGGGR